MGFLSKLFSSESNRKEYASNFTRGGNGRFSMQASGLESRILTFTDVMAIDRTDMVFRIKDLGIKAADNIFESGFTTFNFAGRSGVISSLNKDEYFRLLNS